MTEPRTSWSDEIKTLVASIDLVHLISIDIKVDKNGSTHKACCPFHGENTPSLVIYPAAKGGPPHYHCYGCGAHGDAADWIRDRRNLNARDTLDELRRLAGSLPPAPVHAQREVEEKPSRIAFPVPELAEANRPRTDLGKLGHPTKTWDYRSMHGRLNAIVARYETETGKTIRTFVCEVDDDGGFQWKCTRPSKNLPLYHLDQLYLRPDALVVLCEGEKTADALSAVPGVVGVTWMGGSNNVKTTGTHDWSPLAGRRVVLWPDFDLPGVLAMHAALPLLTAAGALVTGIIDLSAIDPCPNRGDDAADVDPDLLPDWIRDFPRADLTQAIADLLTAVPRKDDFPHHAEIEARAQAIISGTVADSGNPAVDSDGPGPAAERCGDSTLPPEPPAAGPASEPSPTADDDIREDDLWLREEFVRDHTGLAFHCADSGTKEGRWYVWDGKSLAQTVGEGIRELAIKTSLRLARQFDDQARDLIRQAAEADAGIDALRESIKDLKTEGAKADDIKVAVAAIRAKIEPLQDLAEGFRRKAAALKKKAKQIQSKAKIDNMVSLANSDKRLIVSIAELDSNPDLLNTPSGVVNLCTGDVYPHDPKYRCTRITRAAYIPGEPIGRLATVLDNVCAGDADAIRFIQDVFGQAIFGHNRLERFFMLLGPGRSGKGVLMEGIKSAVGNYCGTAEFKSFVQQSGSKVRDDLDRLKEYRIVLCSESNPGESLDTSVLKSFTGGDTISTRALYGSYNEFRPRATLVFATNPPAPRVSDRDGALWERLTIIPTGPTIPKDQRDPGLKDWAIDPERGGRAILAWLIAGAIRTHAIRTLNEPQMVLEASSEYRKENDATRDWIAEWLLLAQPENRDLTFCPVNQVNQSYIDMCAEENISIRIRLSGHRLAEKLESLGCFKRKIRRPHLNSNSPTWVWFGVTTQRQPKDQPAIGSHVPTDAEHMLVMRHHGIATVKLIERMTDVPENSWNTGTDSHDAQALDAALP